MRQAYPEESSSRPEDFQGSHRADAAHEHGDGNGEDQSREHGCEGAFLHGKSLRGAGAEQPIEHAAPDDHSREPPVDQPRGCVLATVVRWGAAGLATGALAATPPPVYAAPVYAIGDSCATPDRTCNLIDAAPIRDRLLLQGLGQTDQGDGWAADAHPSWLSCASIGLHLSTKVSVDPEIGQRHHMVLRLFD